MPSKKSNPELPLSGIRVLELVNGFDMCGRMLADFGAEVIKVEPPGGASTRKMSPVVQLSDDENSDKEISCFFEYRNFNKKSIILDLENSAEDLDKLKELLKSTDILIESAKPGTLKNVGITPKDYPHLIITSITPFGQTGEYSQYEATPEIIFAMSGWLALSGVPGKPPIAAPGYLGYDAAGIMGCFASLVALIKRQRTGMGQHLDVSAVEALAQCGSWGLINASATINADMPPPRMRSGASPLYALFPTSDGMVRLVILSPRQWESMWEWLGKPEEFNDPVWSQTIQRIVNIDVLNPYYAKLFAPLKMESCAEEAQKRGVVVTPMLKPNDILNNPHFISRKTFTETEIKGKKGKLAAGWMEIDSVRVGFRSKSPSPGEDTEEILAQKNEPIQMEQNPDDEPALKDLRVMDFGHGGVGVEGSKLLAEYGADVIKIESRSYMDFMRTVMGTEMSPSFASSSRSKKSLGVNAKDPKGNEVLCKLAEVSDIAIENNSTDTMKNLGMDYKKLSKINPRITMASSQMMGSHGTYSKWIGYGPTIATVGGIDWLWGFDDGDPPPGTPHIHPDHMAGRLCAIASLLGVIAREKTGSGFHAEMAQVEKLICMLGEFFLQESLSPGSVKPQGNNAGGDYCQKDAVWGAYKCKSESEDWEDWCMICVRDESEWDALVELMGSPSWTQDEKLATRKGRLQNIEEIQKGVSNWTKDLPSQEVMKKCQEKKIPAGAMIFPDQLSTDPHYVERGFPLKLKQQGIDTDELYFEGAAFYGSDLPEIYFRQAPLLGEHTREICEDLLKMETNEVEELIKAGTLEITEQE